MTVRAAAPPADLNDVVPVFRGYKRGFVVAIPTSSNPGLPFALAFCGVAQGGLYERDSAAKCLDGHPHSPPAPDCRCGFYALSEKEPIADGVFVGSHPFKRWDAVLTVSLYGEVIEGSEGLRASHQKVELVEFEPRCHRCGHPEVSGLALFKAPAVVRRRGVSVAAPACSRCAARRRTLSFDDASAQLGVEVRLGPPRQSFLAKFRSRWSDAAGLKGRLRAVLPLFRLNYGSVLVSAAALMLLAARRPQLSFLDGYAAIFAFAGVLFASTEGRRFWHNFGVAVFAAALFALGLPIALGLPPG